MPEFDTTGPIDVTIDLPVGDVRITAGDTPGTTVHVRPANPKREADKRVAEQTTVEYADGRLLVKGPQNPVLGLLRPVIGPFNGKNSGIVTVDITVATGSSLSADGGVINLTSTGTLGDCRVKSGCGDIRLDRAGSVTAHTGAGTVVVQAADGDAEVSTGSGEVRVGTVGHGARLKNANGQTHIESVGGALRARASNGGILVGRTGGAVDAATAHGDIRIGEVGPGAVGLKTAMGELEVGVPDGMPAYLDVQTSFGNVQNQLSQSGAPRDGEQHVEIHARTAYGDIVIRRP